MKKKRYTTTGNTVSKWYAKSVRRTVTCRDFSRPSCLVLKQFLNKEEKDQLQPYIKNNQFICINPLLSDNNNHIIETKVPHIINISFDNGIKKEYCNPD